MTPRQSLLVRAAGHYADWNFAALCGGSQRPLISPHEALERTVWFMPAGVQAYFADLDEAALERLIAAVARVGGRRLTGRATAHVLSAVA